MLMSKQSVRLLCLAVAIVHLTVKTVLPGHSCMEIQAMSCLSSSVEKVVLNSYTQSSHKYCQYFECQ